MSFSNSNAIIEEEPELEQDQSLDDSTNKTNVSTVSNDSTSSSSPNANKTQSNENTRSPRFALRDLTSLPDQQFSRKSKSFYLFDLFI